MLSKKNNMVKKFLMLPAAVFAVLQYLPVLVLYMHQVLLIIYLRMQQATLLYGLTDQMLHLQTDRKL